MDMAFSKAGGINTSLTSTEITLIPQGSVRSSIIFCRMPEPLTPAVRQQLHLGQDSHGVVISQVDPNGAAAAAGIREGDLVEEVNHQPVTNVSEFEQAMRSVSGQAILLRVVRDGTGFYVAIAPR
jgi:S1-C subfamily serine protease